MLYFFYMKKLHLGFSLIEIMVVVSIIGIMSAVAYVNFSQGSELSRDAQRQADLQTVSTALELYKNKYGEYPQGCNSPGTWSGHAPDYDCSSGNQYIVGLAPEFIPRLPQDPKLNGDNSGYVYLTNNEGSVYKFIAYRTVESEVVTYDHEFKNCDVDNTASAVPLCNTVYASPYNNNRPNQCRNTNAAFQTSYAVWAGFVVPTVAITNSNYDLFVERGTEDVVCEIP